MRRFALVLLALLVIVACSGAFQSSGSIQSGPSVGSMLPGPFHPINATGSRAGLPHCLVCEYGVDPVVAVFSRTDPAKVGQNAALVDLLKKLDEAVGQHVRDRLHAFAVVLSEMYPNQDVRTTQLKALADAGSSAELKHVVLALGPTNEPANYKLSKDAELIVLVYQEHKVLANFAYAKDKFTDKDITAILGAVDKMLTARK
jgi:hypothetical protein